MFSWGFCSGLLNFDAHLSTWMGPGVTHTWSPRVRGKLSAYNTSQELLWGYSGGLWGL